MHIEQIQLRGGSKYMKIKYIYESSYMDISIINFYDLIFFIIPILIGMHLLRDNIKTKNYIIILIGIFLLMTSYGMYDKYSYIKQIRKVMHNQSYSIVDGRINNLVVMPKGGHALETFIVNDILFEISYTGDYPKAKTLFYTLTKNRNGPIQKNGQRVKIYYIEEELPKICIPFTDKCIIFNENKKNKIIKMWVYDS